MKLNLDERNIISNLTAPNHYKWKVVPRKHPSLGIWEYDHFFLQEFCLNSSRDMLSILAMAWSWYSEVMDSMHPTRIRQVVKNPRATHITVHWDFLPILFWLETDFLGSPVGIEQAGCN